MAKNFEIAEMLVEKGAKVNAQDSRAGTALQWAATEGSLPLVQLLLKKGANVNSRDWFGTTPLMWAAFGKHVGVVKALVTGGANVNSRDDASRRQYWGAQFVGDKAAAERIQETGKLELLHEDGRSVLDWAKMGGSEEIIQMLKNAVAKRGR
jgi:ankyrin repeat protein